MADDTDRPRPRKKAAEPRRPRAGGKRGGDRHTEQARLEQAERTRGVVQLRMAGVDFDTIARELGYADKSGAYRAWKTAMADVVRPVAREAYELELARLDAAQSYVWPQVRKGNLQAVDRFLAISARRARLAGMDAAFRLELTGDDEARKEVQDVVAELLQALQGEEGAGPA